MVAAAVFFLLPAAALAASAKLTWNPNQEEDLAGYKLFVGTSSGNYSSTIDVGSSTSYEVANLNAATTYYFALKAYDVKSNLSESSAEISYTTPVADKTAPTILSVTSPRYQQSKAIQVSYSVSDPSGIAAVKLWVRINSSGWIYSGKSLNKASATFSYTAISDAHYYFAVVAEDTVGNKTATPVGSGASVTTVDALAPSRGNLTAPALVRSNSILLQYSGATDGAGSGIASLALWVKTPSGSWSATGLTSNVVSGVFNYLAQEVGQYYFSIIATDEAGNVGLLPSDNAMAISLFQPEEDKGEEQDEDKIAPEPSPPPPPSTDACPNDPKKTAPGVCGCGVVEDKRDFDLDGIINCLDSDRDGDSVSDSQEQLDGTNPDDAGSVKTLVGTKVCTEWNGFLGRLWNILELVNMSSKQLSITVSLYDSQGHAVEGGKVMVAAGAQRDILIHDMAGRQENQYGLFCLHHDGEAGDLDGRMVYYKGVSESTRKQDFDFAFAMPFSNGLAGSQYVTFNTYHPSFRTADQGNLVANWIQLTNLEQKKQKGNLFFYAMDGKLLGRQNVVVGPSQRTDFSGHQFGANNVGHVAWIPDNPTARFQLRNVRYLYDNPNAKNSFDTAFQVEGMHPSGEQLVVPLQLQDSSAVLEVVNVSKQEMPIVVSFYNEAGELQIQKKFQLAAKSSIHLIANDLLQGLQNAVAIVKAQKRNSIIAVGMHYARLEDGAIKYMYGMQAKQATGFVLKNSYNTYLQQTSMLVLTNAGSRSETLRFSLVRSDGERIVDGYQETLPAHGTKEINLNELSASDQYGVVEVVADNPGKIVAWVKRFRGQEYVVPTPSR